LERQRWASPILLCLLLVSLQKSSFEQPAPPSICRTAFGQHRSVALADSSTLQLNANSLVSVEINERSRAVVVQHGEALLNIAAGGRPFTVHIGSFDFETSQAVRAHIRLDPEGETRLDVLKGQGWIRPAAAARFQPLRVSAGSSFSLRDGVRMMDRFDLDEMTRRLAWTQGQVILAGETLRDAVAEFNRYNRRQLLIGDETIANIPTGGIFYASELDTFTRSLNQLFGIRTLRMRPDVVMLVGDSYSGL
jgi:transmembrane sensor